MKSEALRNIRTMRQVSTSLAVAGRCRCRTTNSLSKTAEEAARLEGLADRRLEQVLARERQRSAALESAVARSRGRLLKTREKLAATINRNRALTALRRELQQARWEGQTLGSETPARIPKKTGRVLDIRY
jgi:predicted  nucleic acid-binding Zn-ribbon protein